MPLEVEIEKNLGSFRLKADFRADNGILGILGASGCGKSVTLRCIAGIITPDRGRIVIDKKPLFDAEKTINLPPQKRQVGLLFQHYALFPHMTLRQNLITGLLSREKNRQKREEEVSRMLKRFCLEGLENHKPFQLSGGQQQRAALARILLSKPHLLMLDEPFSALDDYLRWKMELELQDILNDFPGITLFVSHSREEIYRICHQVCVIDKGSCSAVIPVKKLFEHPSALAAAQLSGCKNYSRAQTAGKNQVLAEDWGVMLISSQEADEEVAYVGVRSHFFHLMKTRGEQRENVISGRILRIIEDVFSIVVIVEPENKILPENIQIQSLGVGHQTIRLETTKEEWKQHCREYSADIGDLLWFYIDRKDVMLLKK